MGYSIELYFEHDFEEKLRSLWDELERAGVPSILHKIGSCPHLSLLILDECNVDHVADLIDGAIMGRYKFPITFPAFSLIPGHQQAVFLTPVMNAELIEMQRRLYRLMVENGYSVQKYYKPHNWLPHCSISKELSPAESLKTLEVCQVSTAIGETLVTDIGFIEFRPRKVIRNYRLNGL
ncbi:MAG: 2'-5' RNA ligase family protein [Desulfobacteraceae bacterium]|jgi:2'-5' RNA ligase